MRLNLELQRSHEALVRAREEERLRIRRDLHDELGPALASLSLKVDAARNLLTQDEMAVEGLLIEVKTQTQAALSDTRRLIYALRPPALDELGLVLAPREQAAQYSHEGLLVQIDAPDALPTLPAAVEVAAYRIAQEALTNMIHHAQARCCKVSLKLDSVLRLEVLDDGIGLLKYHRVG